MQRTISIGRHAWSATNRTGSHRCVLVSAPAEVRAQSTPLLIYSNPFFLRETRTNSGKHDDDTSNAAPKDGEKLCRQSICGALA